MVKRLIICLALSQIHVAISQCLNRQPPNVIFRPIQETIEALNTIPFQQTVIEPPTVPILPPSYQSPTTIVSDCSPSVCKNLINTLQLMIVSNLVKSKSSRGGFDLTNQLASPIIGEVLSSPALPCNCRENFINAASSNYITPGMISPNIIPGLIAPYNVIPGNVYPQPGVTSINNNALYGNVFGILSN